MKKFMMAMLAGLMLVGCGQNKPEEPAETPAEEPAATQEAAPAETAEATAENNGTNYAYLAAGQTVTAEPVNGWYVVVVNQNSAGEISLVNIKEIDVADVHTQENADEKLLGGYTPTDTGKPGMLAGEDAMAAFDEATKSLMGVTLNPITVLGTQVVNGLNYVVLSRGKASTENPEVNLYVTKYHAGTDGTVDGVENALFDLVYYVTPEE